MNLKLLKSLQEKTGTLPKSTEATRAVTVLQGDALKLVGGAAVTTKWVVLKR